MNISPIHAVSEFLQFLRSGYRLPVQVGGIRD